VLITVSDFHNIGKRHCSNKGTESLQNFFYYEADSFFNEHHAHSTIPACAVQKIWIWNTVFCNNLSGFAANP
jgi:hypothetical protein